MVSRISEYDKPLPHPHVASYPDMSEPPFIVPEVFIQAGALQGTANILMVGPTYFMSASTDHKYDGALLRLKEARDQSFHDSAKEYSLSEKSDAPRGRRSTVIPAPSYPSAVLKS